MTHRLHKGKPKTADIPTRAVLEAALAWAADAKQGVYKRAHVRLMERYGCCEKVAVNALEREYDRDFLECGTSITAPWLTAQGVAYLEEPECETK